MRIYVTSDLHFYPNDPQRKVERLSQYLAEQTTPEDVVLLLGDYANNRTTMVECLRLFTKLRAPILAIPGNHDMWGGPERYDDFAKVCMDLGIHPLTTGPQVINGIGFAGCMGWYDYSFRDNLGIPIGAYEAKTYPGQPYPNWGDALHINWGKSDQEVTDWQVEELREQLRVLSRDTAVKKIFVAIHHVPIRELLFFQWARFLIPRHWRFLNAYLGSPQFGQLCGEYRRLVTHVICGHIHNAKTVRKNGIAYTSIDGTIKRPTNQVLIINPESGKMRRKNFR